MSTHPSGKGVPPCLISALPTCSRDEKAIRCNRWAFALHLKAKFSAFWSNAANPSTCVGRKGINNKVKVPRRMPLVIETTTNSSSRSWTHSPVLPNEPVFPSHFLLLPKPAPSLFSNQPPPSLSPIAQRMIPVSSREPVLPWKHPRVIRAHLQDARAVCQL